MFLNSLYFSCQLLEGSGSFSPTFDNSGMNYQSRLQRDLNALGSVAREQSVTQTWLRGTMLILPLTYCFNVYSLFFCYDPLCMSLHDAVADDSCSVRVKKLPDPSNNCIPNFFSCILFQRLEVAQHRGD